jgi:hypothetical protein
MACTDAQYTWPVPVFRFRISCLMNSASQRLQETIMTSQSHTTTDHDEIRQWVEQHDGKPACVRGTGSDNDVGILRIDFPGGTGKEDLKHVSWDEWFDKFDSSDVGFLYQSEKAGGEDSTFFKLVRREA